MVLYKLALRENVRMDNEEPSLNLYRSMDSFTAQGGTKKR